MPAQFVQNTAPYGLYLAGQIKKTISKLYEINYDELWALDPSQNLHNAISDLPIGLEEIDAYAIGDTGQMAALYDGMGDDVPVVDITLGKLPSVKVAVFIQGCFWTEMELEKMAAATLEIPSLNIVALKQKKVGDYLSRREHFTALYGYPNKGLYGIFSLRGLRVPDAAFQPYKKVAGEYSLTPAQLYEDLVDLIYSFMDRSKVSSPSQVQMVIPPKLARRLVQTDGTDQAMTIRQKLASTELGMGVNTIITRNELKGSNLALFVPNETNTGMYDQTYDRIMFKASSYVLERHYFPRKPKPVFQVNSLKYEQVSISATSGIVSYEPEKVMYYDFKNNES